MFWLTSLVPDRNSAAQQAYRTAKQDKMPSYGISPSKAPFSSVSSERVHVHQKKNLYRTPRPKNVMILTKRTFRRHGKLRYQVVQVSSQLLCRTAGKFLIYPFYFYFYSKKLLILQLNYSRIF
jgi:hypothetical protein